MIDTVSGAQHSHSFKVVLFAKASQYFLDIVEPDVRPARISIAYAYRKITVYARHAIHLYNDKNFE